MKVEITKHGFLEVTAETGTEAFALQRWWNDFGKMLRAHVVTIEQQAEGQQAVGIRVDTNLTDRSDSPAS